jgi:hypothetical protein
LKPQNSKIFSNSVLYENQYVEFDEFKTHGQGRSKRFETINKVKRQIDVHLSAGSAFISRKRKRISANGFTIMSMREKHREESESVNASHFFTKFSAPKAEAFFPAAQTNTEVRVFGGNPQDRSSCIQVVGKWSVNFPNEIEHFFHPLTHLHFLTLMANVIYELADPTASGEQPSGHQMLDYLSIKSTEAAALGGDAWEYFCRGAAVDFLATSKKIVGTTAANLGQLTSLYRYSLLINAIDTLRRDQSISNYLNSVACLSCSGANQVSEQHLWASKRFVGLPAADMAASIMKARDSVNRSRTRQADMKVHSRSLC